MKILLWKFSHCSLALGLLFASDLAATTISVGPIEVYGSATWEWSSPTGGIGSSYININFHGSNGNDTISAFAMGGLCDVCFLNPPNHVSLTNRSGSYSPAFLTLTIDGINAGGGTVDGWGTFSLENGTGTGNARIGTGSSGPDQIDASLIGYLNIADVQLTYYQGQIATETVNYIISPTQLNLPEASTAPILLLGLGAFAAVRLKQSFVSVAKALGFTAPVSG
jgi:hypothetical protein